MSFQKCPVCDGSGVTYYPLSSTSSAVCETCNGSRIISEVTGLPPSTSNQVQVIDEPSTKLGKIR